MTKKQEAEILNKAAELKRKKKGYVDFLYGSADTEKQAEKWIELIRNGWNTEELPSNINDSDDFDDLIDTNVEGPGWKLEQTEAPAPVAIEEHKVATKEEDKRFGRNLKCDRAYIYNEVTQQYVVHLKAACGLVKIPKQQHEDMMRAYSNWNGNEKTIEEICLAYQFPRNWFIEYKTIFGWSHSMVPVSDQMLEESSNVELVDKLNMQRKFEIQQDLEREKWRDIQENSEKWKAFKAKQLDPFSNFLTNWNPPEHLSTECMNGLWKPADQTGEATYMVGLTDIHFGSKASSAQSLRGEEYNGKVIGEGLVSLVNQMIEDVASRTINFDKVIVPVLGDILHGLRGHTEKGTPLKMECTKEEQWELASNHLIYFFNKMLLLFPSVEVHIVKGNHAGADDAILFMALAMYYRSECRINFNIASYRCLPFKVRNTLFLMDHGNTPEYEAAVPKSGTPREAFIQNLLLQRPELLQNINSKIFIQGDRHHVENMEYGGFEFMMFGCPVKADDYANNLGLFNRPRYNGLIVNEDGISSVLNFYV